MNVEQARDLAEIFHPSIPEFAGEPFDAELAALIGLAAAPASPSPSLREKVLGAARRSRTAPRTVLREEAPGIHVLRAGDGDWRPTAYPGIYSKLLVLDKNSGLATSLLKIEPGASYPPHRHAREEQTYIITGDLDIGSIHLEAGDYSTAALGTTHGAIRSRSGCVALVTSSIHDEILA